VEFDYSWRGKGTHMNKESIILHIKEMARASGDLPDPEFTEEMIKGYVIACNDIIKMLNRMRS
jgi:hypothetical protein